jgi:hypothetical protein
LASANPGTGWPSQNIDGLAHDHPFLFTEHAGWNGAIGYWTRDDALIVSHSSIEALTSGAALLDALELANAISDTYDAVDHPEWIEKLG